MHIVELGLAFLNLCIPFLKLHRSKAAQLLFVQRRDRSATLAMLSFWLISLLISRITTDV